MNELNTNIQTATAQMGEAFLALGTALVSGLGNAFSNIISNMELLVNQATMIKETLGSIWNADQATIYSQDVLDVITALEALAAITSVVTLLTSVQNMEVLGSAAAWTAATIATWAQQAATVAMSIAPNVQL